MCVAPCLGACARLLRRARAVSLEGCTALEEQAASSLALCTSCPAAAPVHAPPILPHSAHAVLLPACHSAPAEDEEEEGRAGGVFFDEDEVLAGAAAASLGVGDVEEVRCAFGCIGMNCLVAAG